jgi:hypothetical protein
VQCLETRNSRRVRKLDGGYGKAGHESDLRIVRAISTLFTLTHCLQSPSTFTPQIQASGRPVTTDDLEKDHILSQRIRLFGWVSERHLDIPVEENNEGFLNFARQGKSSFIVTMLTLTIPGRVAKDQSLQGT